MAQILLALNFGEMGALESAENSDFFHVRKNLYAQLAQNLIADQPPPPFLYGTPVKYIVNGWSSLLKLVHSELGHVARYIDYDVFPCQRGRNQSHPFVGSAILLPFRN